MKLIQCAIEKICDFYSLNFKIYVPRSAASCNGPFVSFSQCAQFLVSISVAFASPEWWIHCIFFKYLTRYVSHIYWPLWTASWSAILHVSRTFMPFFSSALAIFSVTSANWRFEKMNKNFWNVIFWCKTKKKQN